jgi:hypothetical protein
VSTRQGHAEPCRPRNSVEKQQLAESWMLRSRDERMGAGVTTPGASVSASGAGKRGESFRMASEKWTEDAVLRARHLARAGASLDEIRAAIGTKMSGGALQKKLMRDYGVRVSARRTAHEGTSKLNVGGRRRDAAKG